MLSQIKLVLLRIFTVQKTLGDSPLCDPKIVKTLNSFQIDNTEI